MNTFKLRLKKILKSNYFGRYILGGFRSFRHTDLLVKNYDEYLNEGFSKIELRNGNVMFLYSSDVKASGYYDGSSFQDILNYIWEDVLKDSNIVFDLGANYGQFVLGFLTNDNIRHLDKVVAFEPNPKINRAISESIKFNGLEKNVSIESFGVSNKNERISFFINLHSSGGSSINSSNAFNPVQGIYRKKIDIDVICLDKYVKDSSLQLKGKKVAIKIDVEGHDFQALQGAISVLTGAESWVVLMETTMQDARRILENQCYDVIDLFDKNYLYVTYANAIFQVDSFDDYLKHFQYATGCIDVVVSSSELDIKKFH